MRSHIRHFITGHGILSSHIVNPCEKSTGSNYWIPCHVLWSCIPERAGWVDTQLSLLCAFLPSVALKTTNTISVDDIWNKSYMNWGNEMKMKKWSSQWTQFMQLRKEAWKKIWPAPNVSGFIAQLVEHRPGKSRGHGFKPRWSPGFFSGVYAIAFTATIISSFSNTTSFVCCLKCISKWISNDYYLKDIY